MLNPRRSTSTGRDERGFSLVLMSLFLVALLGMAGLVVDLGAWQVEASRIQQAADAAALAGVVRLPEGDTEARKRAIEVAADNGFDDAHPDVTVTVEPRGDETLEVTVKKENVSQYFTRVVRGGDTTTITRTSTAQYVQPVPLGSPRNYLGTNSLPIGVTGDGVENFYLAVSGECARREYGDRITPRAMSNPMGSHSCAGALPNLEHDEEGYLFGISVPPANGTATVALQMFDAPVCTGGGAQVITGEQGSTFETEVTVRRNNALDPLEGDVLVESTFSGESSTTGMCVFGDPDSDTGDDDECESDDALRECWTTLADLPGAGEYTVQVEPVFGGDFSSNEHHNSFSLRARSGPTFVPCTADEAQKGNTSATPQWRAECTQVFGFEHLPIWARGNNDPVFFLSSIDSRHNGKTLQVTLFDSAEGASTISLKNPIGGYEPFTWEILCADGSQATAGCPNETDPEGGRSSGPTKVTSVDVSGTTNTNRTFQGYNIQNGKYSDRLLRLTVELPADMEAVYGDKTWWKIEYGGDFDGDRTTWSVQLLGDPVRLLPNSPPTTAAPTP